MPARRLRRLSSRELSLLVLLGFGLSDEEMARTADLDSEQVETTLAGIGRFLAWRLGAFADTAPRELDLDPDVELSPRQLEVVRLAAAGLTDAEIAAELGLGLRTAESHMAAALARLRLRSRRQLIGWVGRRS